MWNLWNWMCWNEKIQTAMFEFSEERNYCRYMTIMEYIFEKDFDSAVESNGTCWQVKPDKLTLSWLKKHVN